MNPTIRRRCMMCHARIASTWLRDDVRMCAMPGCALPIFIGGGREQIRAATENKTNPPPNDH